MSSKTPDFTAVLKPLTSSTQHYTALHTTLVMLEKVMKKTAKVTHIAGAQEKNQNK